MGISDYSATDSDNKTVPGSPVIDIGKGISGSPNMSQTIRRAIQRIMADLKTAGDKLDGIEASADVTDATNVDAAGAVMEADYDANTILAATTDDTPAALTVAEDRVVGRISGGNIAALTAAQLRTLANVEDGADVTDAANVGSAIDGATGKTTPVDADTVGVIDSAASNVLKKLTWANIKATLKTYFDTLYEAVDADILKADTADVLTAGFATTPYSAGTKSSGTFTPDEANGNFQYAVNGGAHTLAPPTNNCSLVVQYTNNASAGAVTTSGFTLVDGDTISTTNGDDFFFFIVKCNGFSSLTVKALQ